MARKPKTTTITILNAYGPELAKVPPPPKFVPAPENPNQAFILHAETGSSSDAAPPGKPSVWCMLPTSSTGTVNAPVWAYQPPPPIWRADVTTDMVWGYESEESDSDDKDKKILATMPKGSFVVPAGTMQLAAPKAKQKKPKKPKWSVISETMSLPKMKSEDNDGAQVVWKFL